MLTGKFHQTANGRRSYEIFNAAPEIIFPISEILSIEFDCTPPQIPTIGVDAVITECHKDNIKLNLGWDNWSGFYIFAESQQGDALIDKIGSHINELLKAGNFKEFEEKA